MPRQIMWAACSSGILPSCIVLWTWEKAVRARENRSSSLAFARFLLTFIVSTTSPTCSTSILVTERSVGIRIRMPRDSRAQRMQYVWYHPAGLLAYIFKGNGERFLRSGIQIQRTVYLNAPDVREEARMPYILSRGIVHRLILTISSRWPTSKISFLHMRMICAIKLFRPSLATSGPRERDELQVLVRAKGNSFARAAEIDVR